MNLFINIGPLAKAEMNGKTYYGQLKDGYLFMEKGVVKLTEDAVITEIKLTPENK